MVELVSARRAGASAGPHVWFAVCTPGLMPVTCGYVAWSWACAVGLQGALRTVGQGGRRRVVRVGLPSVWRYASGHPLERALKTVMQSA
jgi:hypothetical protein